MESSVPVAPVFLIMNAAECEPLLHKDMEMLRNYTDDILNGLQTAIKMTHASSGLIGIKDKHNDVIELLEAKITANVQIVKCGDFYPAGDEVTLVYLTTGRVIQPGELPASVGCLVQNVETLFNISQNKPVVDKFISVAGAVEQPATIRVPIGTSFSDIITKFNITTRNYKVRSGGLMMGHLEKNLNQVITKRTGAILILPSDHYCVQTYERFRTDHDIDRIAKAGCDQCNFCTEFCPRYLLGHPVRPETAMRNRMFTREGEPFLHIGNAFCCECNLCTFYACPESLDPKGATVIEKRLALQQQTKWEGLPVSTHPMLDYRKVPTKKLKQRLDVLKYKDEGPLKELEFSPKRVRIPLLQHIGAPANPIVEVGDQVKKYDRIAAAIVTVSANVHASIDGKVIAISNEDITIQRN